jgi:hypothetical protein
MPVLVRTAPIAALITALLVPAQAAAAGLERGSPFYRAAPYVPPAAATFSAPFEAGRFRPVHLNEARPAPRDGRLPNQRTGPARDRMVRDICIGC